MSSFLQAAFVVGIETSGLAIEWAMAKILCNLHIIKKAKTEADVVVGQNRKVHESNIPNLKYIKVIVKESFGLHSIICLLIPHRSNVVC